MTIEAMKQALEALECIFASTHPYRGDDSTFTDKASTLGDKAITCLRQAIEQAEKQEPVAYNKTEINGFVQNLYDKKMQEGKHGHYETMFHCVHQAIARVTPPPLTGGDDRRHIICLCPDCATPPQRTWVGLTDEELAEFSDAKLGSYDLCLEVEAKLKEKNT